MGTQHATLSLERWRTFPRERQILMIANELHRGGKLFAPEDRGRLHSCYERVLNLTDLTIAAQPARSLRRELLRWRDLVALLYVAGEPDPAAHEAALSCLLRTTPASAAQIPYVLPRPDRREG
ncbi:MAG TPA: hypothetical protein VG389_14875 [Myxococcota bacterium]|jgi:TRAP-type uncharacterized transport system substrate-binding protein|nr:hypothetical protein [Myxococcota bacterium]